MPTAVLNRIIPFSSVDGPGNRTALFFQGCNFRCTYCHNPETINTCTHCGICVSSCPSGALSIRRGRVFWEKEICTGCDTCLKTCPNLSSPKTSLYTVGDVLDEIRKVAPFLTGITCSGGECTLQADFLIALFRRVHAELKLNCFIDTNGGIQLEEILLKETDQFMLDVKAWNPEDHLVLTGQPAENVRNNLRVLLDRQKLYEVRTVILPGMDNTATVKDTARIIGSSCRYKLIPYRPFGVRREGLSFHGETSPSAEEMEEYRSLALSEGAGTVIIAG